MSPSIEKTPSTTRMPPVPVAVQGEEAAQVVRIVVLELLDLGADGEARAVVDAGVVLPVEVDRVALAREGRQDAEVDLEARRKRHAGRLFHEDGEALFQLDVDVERAVQEAAAGAAGAVLPDGLDRALLDLRMRGQAEVVVRPQHDHLAAAHRDDRVLARLDGPEEREEAGSAKLVRNRISSTLFE